MTSIILRPHQENALISMDNNSIGKVILGTGAGKSIIFIQNTIKQFEDKLLDRISREIKRGKLEGDVKDITLRMFREFYQFMWMNRSYWEPRLKNA
jgi:superfamily II DNA or RNA helicase